MYLYSFSLMNLPSIYVLYTVLHDESAALQDHLGDHAGFEPLTSGSVPEVWCQRAYIFKVFYWLI